MATGDGNDMRDRLRSLIPGGWFNWVAPVRDAVLGGLGDSLSFAYQLLTAVRAGMRRIGTTGWLLDLDAYGFFGDSFLRKANETDDAWRKRYTDEIFRPRVTRAAIDKALFDLTGRHPVILEMFNPGDTGGYGSPNIAYRGGNVVSPRVAGYGIGQGGYNVGNEGYSLRSISMASSPGAGSYGSLQYPYQIFITAFRPKVAIIPNVAGYGAPVGGYGVGTITYAQESDVQSTVSDAEIYATIARTAAAGVIPWTAIQN